MRQNLKLKIQIVTALACAAGLYLTIIDWPWIAFFVLITGFKLVGELYKIDEYENPDDYIKDKK